MGWKTEVIADRSGKWVGNDLCFPTSDDAGFYVRDLMWRWTSVTDHRVVEGDWPVTHRWNDDNMKAERLEGTKS